MAKKVKDKEPEVIIEKIEPLSLEEVMGDRYATYAKYVIQDRAIPDARDGLKPVQRRIIYSMYKSGNVSTKPTIKCAHTVGAVMGNYHPHGDSSIYEALARMSQDWKVREPLIDFQGNNGSINGDVPAAYRYTEARLSELADEMVKDIDKDTVKMNLTFDDKGFEPDVLPSRFPNLLVNGSEGIAVALATEIPTHNLTEVCEATIYRMEHPNCEVNELRNYLLGPDFPTGGIIYRSEGLDQIYLTGRGKIEIASKCEITQNDGITQIVITEIPYKVVLNQLVFQIDKIRHDKIVDGISEVRDESDLSGLRVVIDLKKDAKAETILAYLMKSTDLKTNYSANMVAIVDGRPKTMSLDMILDSYIAHQVDVITRRSNFDLTKFKLRLHIVDGLIIAIDNLNEVVEIIKSSKDKQEAKINLEKKYSLSNEQSEAIVMMPLYKLTHTDTTILKNEKKELDDNIAKLEEILSDPKKLNKVIITDLRQIAKKYGTPRRTSIEEKGDVVTSFSKRDLISHEDTMICITRDGYVKRSSIKSYKSSDGALPGLKEGDLIVYQGQANTQDYLLAFTNKGNYLFIPIYEINEGKWKDEGKHINYLINFSSQEESIIKCYVVSKFRSDLYFALISKRGQLKRTRISEFMTPRYNKPLTAIKLLKDDELASVILTSGSSNLLVFTSDGDSSYFSETCLTPVSPKASGVKGISSLGTSNVAGMLAFEEDERSKIILVTDYGNVRIYDNTVSPLTKRLGKLFNIFRCFKNEPHKLVYVEKVDDKKTATTIIALTQDKEQLSFVVDDYHLTPIDKYASKSTIGLKKGVKLAQFFRFDEVIINDDIVSKDCYVPPVKVETPIVENESLLDENEVMQDSETLDIMNENLPSLKERHIQKEQEESNEEEKDEEFSQISIFGDDDLD